MPEKKEALSSPEQADSIWMLLANFLGTGFYSGYCPRAPGTAGTLAAMVLVFFLYSLLPALDKLSIHLCLALSTIVLGIISANMICKSGRYGKETKDPKQIVIDEFAGYFVSIIGLSARPLEFALAFICFRVFDIIKPPPIKSIEQLPRGYGIVLDDVMAGLYAALSTRAVLYLIT